MSTTAPARKRAYRMAARAEAAAATRRRILESAWRRFSQSPYDDVRIADVARDAGVSSQTVHAGFHSKDDLFVSAWARAIAPEGERRLHAPVGDVRRAIRLLYDSYEESGDAVLRLLAQEDRIPAVRKMTDSGRSWHRRWVERTFAPLLEGLSGAARERRLVTLVVATDLQVWKLLRRDMDLGRPAAERVVVEMVTERKGRP